MIGTIELRRHIKMIYDENQSDPLQPVPTLDEVGLIFGYSGALVRIVAKDMQISFRKMRNRHVMARSACVKCGKIRKYTIADQCLECHCGESFVEVICERPGCNIIKRKRRYVVERRRNKGWNVYCSDECFKNRRVAKVGG